MLFVGLNADLSKITNFSLLLDISINWKNIHVDSRGHMSVPDAYKSSFVWYLVMVTNFRVPDVLNPNLHNLRNDKIFKYFQKIVLKDLFVLSTNLLISKSYLECLKTYRSILGFYVENFGFLGAKSQYYIKIYQSMLKKSIVVFKIFKCLSA